MNIISAQGEKSITELARRVFSISGSHGSAAERAAVAALTKANPHLTTGKPVDAGTPVFVPPVGHAGAHEPAGESLADMKGIAALVREALGHVGKELELGLAAQRASEESFLAGLKEHSRELNATGDDAATRIKDLQKAAKLRLEETETQSGEQRTALAGMRRDLDTFLKTFQGTSG